jgi:hypothetical protein
VQAAASHACTRTHAHVDLHSDTLETHALPAFSFDTATVTTHTHALRCSSCLRRPAAPALVVVVRLPCTGIAVYDTTYRAAPRPPPAARGGGGAAAAARRMRACIAAARPPRAWRRRRPAKLIGRPESQRTHIRSAAGVVLCCRARRLAFTWHTPHVVRRDITWYRVPPPRTAAPRLLRRRCGSSSASHGRHGRPATSARHLRRREASTLP